MALWQSLYGGRPELRRKMLFGSVLVKDYDPAFDLSTIEPFDSATGALQDMTTSGLKDCGRTSSDGVTFAPTVNTDDSTSWQSRQTDRSDMTEDSETAQATFVETNPLTVALFKGVPLADVPALSATAGMDVKKPPSPSTIYRTVLVIGADSDDPTNGIYGVILYPRCAVTGKGQSQWHVGDLERQITFTPFFETTMQTSAVEMYDGPGWRALTPAAG